MVTQNPEIYDPRRILQHTDFKVLAPGEKTDADTNIAAFYNPSHEIHLVKKPKPTPGPGQVLIHVRATGICGSVAPSCMNISLILSPGVMSISGAMVLSGL